jgi:hypothetical protein
VATVEEMTERLERLRRIRGAGTRRVRDSSGNEVEYRTDRELEAAIAFLERQLAGGGRIHTVKITATKGLE